MYIKLIKFLIINLFILINYNLVLCSEDVYIKVQVEGISDTTAYLGYHHGGNQFVKDTVDVDSEGNFAFIFEEKLPEGMYFIVVPDRRHFEVIIDQNQHFKITTNVEDLTGAIVFENSRVNSAFYDYMSFIRKKGEEVRPIRQKMHDPTISEEKRDSLAALSKQIDKEVENKQESYIEDYPDCVLSMIFRAQRQPPVPEEIFKEDGSPDHDASYYKYIKAFWNNVDLSDERMIRTPIYHSMLEHFFDNIVIQYPDSIISTADWFIDKTRDNDEMFKYTLSYLTRKYERAQIMGMENVFVHLVMNYYKTGEVFWIEEERLNRIIDRAKRLEPLLIGKTAPNIKMYKPDKTPVSLHDVSAKYLIVNFYDTGCPACRRQTPKIKELHEKFKEYDVKVFGASADSSKDKWLEYIEKQEIQDWINVNDIENKSRFRDKYDIYAIPMIFLLDENKKIVARDIGVEQLEQLLTFKLKEDTEKPLKEIMQEE